MSPPCRLTEDEDGRIWLVENKSGEQLRITIEEIGTTPSHELGTDPGLVKDGVEAHLQELLAEHIELLGEGLPLVSGIHDRDRPVDILCRDAEEGRSVAVEIKQRGEIDAKQLTRYLELLNRDPLLTPVAGVFAAQQIKPQARTLAEDRGIRCLTLDYDSMRAWTATSSGCSNAADDAGQDGRTDKCGRPSARRDGPTGRLPWLMQRDDAGGSSRPGRLRLRGGADCRGTGAQNLPMRAATTKSVPAYRVAVWRVEDTEGTDRRHWHTPCWLQPRQPRPDPAAVLGVQCAAGFGEFPDQNAARRPWGG